MSQTGAARRHPRGTRRAVSWALIGQVSAIMASTTNFLVLARLLGPAEYGLVAATWALVLAASPIAALGSDRLIARDMSARGMTAGRALGSGLLTSAIGWFVVIGLLAALQPWILPQTSLALLLLLALADIVALGTTSLITALCFASANARLAGVTTVLVNLTKLTAVVVFALAPGEPDPVRWAGLYAVLALVSAASQLTYVIARFGRPSLEGYSLRERVRHGAPYSGNIVAMVVQNDADKTLLVRAGLDEAAGHYSVAYRLASIAYVPVLAVLQTTFPRFFAAGAAGGLPATVALARSLARPLLGYGVVAVVGLVACAPLIPVLVGEQYRPSVWLLMLLAPLVLLKIIQSLAGDVLTGAGFQNTRTRCVAVAAAANVATNLVLIPLMGVRGALIATAMAELLQAGLLVGAVVRRQRARRAEGHPPPTTPEATGRET